MRQQYFPTQWRPFADIVVLGFICFLIYISLRFASEWSGGFHPVSEVYLSYKYLPLYTFFSALRGIIAYIISLIFTLTIGYIAAKSAWAERLLIPILDILQSIPVLGFLPGLVLGLVAIFPNSNVGLELACILMIFTGQVWNMTFSFYGSLKSIPNELKEASDIIGMSPWRKFMTLELPFSAVNLVWNSVMSMAGGWFFLSVCEAFTLGTQQFRLPGLGSYMSLAFEQSNNSAIVGGLIAMIILILIFDNLIWRPLLSWVYRFRVSDIPGVTGEEPFIRLMLRDSIIVRWMKLKFKKYRSNRRIKAQARYDESLELDSPILKQRSRFSSLQKANGLKKAILVLCFGIIIFAFFDLILLLAKVPATEWLRLSIDLLITFLRVIAALLIATLWTVPVGLWIAGSSQRIRFFQPIIQILATFPAPMIYPLTMSFLLSLHITLGWGSILLLTLGIQWLLLFNVLAGAMRTPNELRQAMVMINAGHIQKWKMLYLPSIFPSLVTGWITAAGGAWNASIVAEIINFKGQTISTRGLGSSLSEAAFHANFPILAACLCLMVAFVILMNRTIWAKLYSLAQSRFRIEQVS